MPSTVLSVELEAIPWEPPPLASPNLGERRGRRRVGGRPFGEPELSFMYQWVRLASVAINQPAHKVKIAAATP